MSKKSAKSGAKATQMRPEARERRLSEQAQNFVREYLIDLNGTQAAIRAGYSARTARQQAARLLSNVDIQKAIATERAKTAERLDLSREAVLRQYQRLGFSDPRKFFRADGTLKAITELDDDTAAAVQGFEVEMRAVDGPDTPLVPVVKVKWADKRAALDSIMKAQAWNKTDVGNEANPLTGLLKALGQRSALPVVAVVAGDGGAMPAIEPAALPVAADPEEDDDD